MTAQIHKGRLAGDDASLNEIFDEFLLIVAGENLHLSVSIEVLLMVAVVLVYQDVQHLFNEIFL